MLIAWLLHQPAVTAPIVGPRTEEHLDLALTSTEVEIHEHVAARLDAIVPPGSSVTNFLNNKGAVQDS